MGQAPGCSSYGIGWFWLEGEFGEDVGERKRAQGLMDPGKVLSAGMESVVPNQNKTKTPQSDCDSAFAHNPYSNRK